MKTDITLIRNIWIFTMLFIGSISDIREKTVSSGYLLIYALGCVAVSVPGFDPHSFFPGLLPGLFLLLFSRLSSGAIGEGDAYAVGFIGMTLGLYAAASVLMLALLIISAYAVVMISLKKAGRRSRIALYPFLSLAFLLRLIIIISPQGGN
ncbi:MAG: hypothetical protein K6B44_02845 [Lachnospiraceae bacterium]|nr:hypothetical protein [Lachnospiraceae bacterium]